MNLYILGINIGSYWSMLVIATIVCVYLSIKRAPAFNIKSYKAVIITILLVIYGCIGAKILFLIENPSEFSLSGGMSFFGSVFFVPIAIAVTALVSRIRISKCMDFIAIYIPLILAFMRIGCYFNGCCGGRTCTIGDTSFVPPMQLIECFFDIIIFSLLYASERKNNIKYSGEQYPKFMIMYAIIRMVMEFFRETEKNIFGMSSGQWFSIVSFLIGTAALILLGVKQKRKLER